MIQLKNDFLWTTGEDRVRVRKRTGAIKPNIELICDEELSEAVNLVLHRQFATSRENLVTEAARLLGFKSTRTNITQRIEAVIDESMKSKVLHITSNGMVDLTDRSENGGKV